jgi:NAD(P)H-hydrate epimerase
LGGHILLKGSGSLIISPENNVSLCPYGNPGMASGGMGDVLSGVIGGLIAQGFELGFALKLATSLHAYAADIETKESGERGLCATDLIPTIRKSLNKLDAKSDG